MSVDNVNLNYLATAVGAITSIGGRADGGSALKLVHLDGTIDQLGFVLAVPNISNLLRPGFDPSHPLAAMMSPDGLEKIIFSPASDVASLPDEAQVVVKCQTILGRAKDNINSIGCGILADNVPVLQMTKNSGGSIDITPFGADSENTFLAIPVGGTVNTASGFSGVRYIFDEMWLLPSQGARAMINNNPGGFNNLVGAQLQAINENRVKLMTVVGRPNPAIRQHICNTAKAQGCP